jgi:Outer membrane protein beta-barrel domain
MRSVIVSACAVAALATAAAPCAAQTFGLGGRMTMVRGDIDAGTSAERFFGGQMKLRLSPRAFFEISLDRRTDSNEALTERTVDMPIQGSLLVYPVRTRLAPYVLGGVGWYMQRVEQLDAGTVSESATSRRFGYHAGIGGELTLGRHAGVHADYRYTFLKFGNDDEEGSLLGLGRFKPSYEGSMWTAGLTLYF